MHNQNEIYKPNQAPLGLENQADLGLGLDWMLQSPQVDDHKLIAACLHEIYPGMLALMQVLTGSRQQAFNLAVDAICDAIHQRYQYWAAISARAWVYRFLIKRWKSHTRSVLYWLKGGARRKAVRRLPPMRLLLCDGLGFDASEAAAALSDSLDLADKRLQNDRQTCQPELETYLKDLNQFHEPLTSQQIEEVYQVVIQQAGLLRRRTWLSRGGLALAVISGVVAILGWWGVALNALPGPTPTMRIVLVTATPEPSATTTPTSTPTLKPTIGPSPTPQGIFVLGGENIAEILAMTAMDVTSPTYSGPDSLQAVLGFWRIPIGQDVIRAAIQPGHDQTAQIIDLQNYAAAQGLDSIFLLAGDEKLLRTVIKAGFPVIVQIGEVSSTGWLARFVMIRGYDEYHQNFITYRGEPSQGWVPLIAFDQLKYQWEYLNSPFLVIYDPRQDGARRRLQDALGDYSLPKVSYLVALERAQKALNQNSQGVWRFFAQFNIGSAYYHLTDFENAANAYDSAFAMYAALPESDRPKRLLWYQTQPYPAYYFRYDYERIVDLATQTIEQAGLQPLDDSLYWRGIALMRLGEFDQAVADLQETLRINPLYAPAQVELDSWFAR